MIVVGSLSHDILTQHMDVIFFSECIWIRIVNMQVCVHLSACVCVCADIYLHTECLIIRLMYNALY